MGFLSELFLLIFRHKTTFSPNPQKAEFSVDEMIKEERKRG